MRREAALWNEIGIRLKQREVRKDEASLQKVIGLIHADTQEDMNVGETAMKCYHCQLTEAVITWKMLKDR